jgi:hypothetical protein
MTDKWFKPKRHVGYEADRSPEWNVALGRSKGYSYLTVGRQLQALANVEENRDPSASRKFRESAKLAFKLNGEHQRR